MTDPEFNRLMDLINSGKGFIEAHAMVEAERNPRSLTETEVDQLKGHRDFQYVCGIPKGWEPIFFHGKLIIKDESGHEAPKMWTGSEFATIKVTTQMSEEGKAKLGPIDPALRVLRENTDRLVKSRWEYLGRKE